jgi:hypothetical protein
MSIGRIFLTATVVLLVAGCAERGGVAAGDVEMSPAAGGSSSFDWQHPFPDGQEVAVADVLADRRLTVPFVPRVPEGMTPISAFEAPAGWPPEHRQLAMTFTTQTGGSFVIFEYPIDAGAARAELDSVAHQQPGCTTGSLDPDVGGAPTTCHFGSGRWVALADGSEALSYEGANGRALFIVVRLTGTEADIPDLPATIDEPAVEIEIQAPKDQMSADELEKVASSLVRAG